MAPGSPCWAPVWLAFQWGPPSLQSHPPDQPNFSVFLHLAISFPRHLEFVLIVPEGRSLSLSLSLPSSIPESQSIYVDESLGNPTSSSCSVGCLPSSLSLPAPWDVFPLNFPFLLHGIFPLHFLFLFHGMSFLFTSSFCSMGCLSSSELTQLNLSSSICQLITDSCNHYVLHIEFSLGFQRQGLTV